MLKLHSAREPAVYMTGKDFDQLSERARAAAQTPGGSLLLHELNSMIIAAETSARPFVRLNSTVEFEDLDSGRVRCLKVCLPEGANLEEQRVSVLSPVGAALIGLSVGRAFAWRTAAGQMRRLRAISVSHG